MKVKETASVWDSEKPDLSLTRSRQVEAGLRGSTDKAIRMDWELVVSRCAVWNVGHSWPFAGQVYHAGQV